MIAERPIELQPAILRLEKGVLQFPGLRTGSIVFVGPELIAELHMAFPPDKDRVGIGFAVQSVETENWIAFRVECLERLVFHFVTIDLHFSQIIIVGVVSVARSARGLVHHEPVGEIRAIVGLGVGPAGPTVAGIGPAVDVDELIFESAFLFLEGGIVIIHRVILVAQQAGHLGRLIERALGVELGGEGAFADLLIVGLAGAQLVGIDVEGDGSGAEPERVQMGVRIVEGGLEGFTADGQQLQLRHGGAVDLLDAGVDGIDIGQHGIAGRPVVVGSLVGA